MPCLGWLGRDEPELDDARSAVHRIIDRALHAAGVIKRIRALLRNVLLNLILNSNEAMSAVDWPARELVISSQESKPGEVAVCVRDSGPGFKQDSERIFDPFSSTKEGGLGLSISRTIVDAHGGRIWATENEGRKGKGVTFHFILPALGAGEPGTS